MELISNGSNACAATLVIKHTFFVLEAEVGKSDCCRRGRAMTDTFVLCGSEAKVWDSESTVSGSACASPRSLLSSEAEPEAPIEITKPRAAVSTGKAIAAQATRPVHSGPDFTTAMVKGLPATFNRDALLELLDSEGYAGLYDFIYVPVDLLTTTHYGFAFVNFVRNEVAIRAMETLQGYQLSCGATLDAIWSEPHQGLEAHVQVHRNNPLLHPSLSEAHRPMLFSDGIRIAFPAPTKKIRLQPLFQQLRRRQRQQEELRAAGSSY